MRLSVFPVKKSLPLFVFVKKGLLLPVLTFCIATLLGHSTLIAFATPVSSVSSGGLQALLSENSEASYVFQVTAPRGALKTNVFVIENPIRIVVDIEDYHSERAENVELETAQLKSLRTGIHPDKVRFVLDCVGAQPPQIESFHDDTMNRLTVRISFDGKSGSLGVPDRKVSKVETQKPIGEATFPDTLSKKLPRAQQTLPSVQPMASSENSVEGEELPAPQEREPKKNKPELERIQLGRKSSENPVIALRGNKKVRTSVETTTVSGIFFKTLLGSAGPAIMLDVETVPEHSLQQRKPSVYEITLLNSKLSGPHLSLPQFPPESFEGFEVVVARQRNNDVAIMVHVIEGVELETFNANGKLWIKIKD